MQHLIPADTSCRQVCSCQQISHLDCFGASSNRKCVEGGCLLWAIKVVTRFYLPRREPCSGCVRGMHAVLRCRGWFGTTNGQCSTKNRGCKKHLRAFQFESDCATLAHRSQVSALRHCKCRCVTEWQLHADYYTTHLLHQIGFGGG